MALLRFPDGFRWGAATASYQIEGGWDADGKGESIWDRFAHTPGKITTGDTGDVACDSYHRFLEDVALLREMQLSSYRFSIAWPRVIPAGRGAVNARGIDYYGRLVDALLEASIRPFPTLYHWDLPQALEDDGGWTNRDTAARFAEYASVMVEALGDRVEHWMIFNEPLVFTALGYGVGMHAPGRRSLDAAARAIHTATLAEGDAFRAMKAARPDAVVGTALSMSPCEPLTDSAGDAAASERAHAFLNLTFLEPALRGRYPAEAFLNELPADRMGIEDGDMARAWAALDFVGINLYTRTVVSERDDDDALGFKADIFGLSKEPSGPTTAFGWEVWPQALYDMIMRITRDYDRPVIEITENGCSYPDGPGDDGVVRDTKRIEFFRGYIAAVHRAIQDGADVRGYHAWTLLDNFEWAEGYRQRFGLTHVDFESPERTRTLKESGRWYGRVAAANGLDPDLAIE